MKYTNILNENTPEYIVSLLDNQESELFKEQIRQKEYSEVIPKLKGERHAYVLWSGGLDSTTALLMALESNIKVTTVNFNYGQSYYEKELAHIKKLTPLIENEYSTTKWVEHISIDISMMDEHMKSLLPGTWGHIFPVRNYILLYEVYKIIKKHPYTEIWFGCIEGEIDFSGGDKSMVFITEAQKQFMESNVRLVTPLIGMGKADCVRWTMDKQRRYEAIKESISCFSGDGLSHCGKCMSCFNRGVGFNAAGKIDDVGYSVSLQNLSPWIEYYSDRILSDNPYSITKLEDIQTYIDFIKHNG
jgi:7-cyano-7-deazaguanine synthase